MNSSPEKPTQQHSAPAWVRSALERATELRFLFQNAHGESWCAEIGRAGQVTVSGQDVDWTPVTVTARDVPTELEAQRAAALLGGAPLAPLAGRWIIGEPERAWWVSVLLVAVRMRPRSLE